VFSDYNFERSKELLKAEGYEVEFAEDWNSRKMDEASKVKAIHDAYSDNSVDIIVCSFGGTHSVSLVDKLDYSLISHKPKPFVGFSDITVLLNAIFVKTGNSTFYGPLYFTLQQQFEQAFTFKYFNRAVSGDSGYELGKAKSVQDYDYAPGSASKINEYWVIKHGKSEGITVGGHIPTFSLLQGTEYFPNLRDKVLLLEMNELDEDYTIDMFYRLLKSLKMQIGFNELKGVLIGTFHSRSKVTFEMLSELLIELMGEAEIPILANCSFGHTIPFATIPIGLPVMIETNGEPKITIYQQNLKPTEVWL